jgi:hypothetical protein
MPQRYFGLRVSAPARVTGCFTDLFRSSLQELLAGNQLFAANQLTSVEDDLIIVSQRQ